MVRTLTYPKTPNNTVKRYNPRATYGVRDIHSIINSVSVLHVIFHAPEEDDPFPAILPMIGTTAAFSHPNAGLDEPLDCYIHGYVSSPIMKTVRFNQVLPVSISATKVDGIVLSLTPNTHSFNYRSAVLFGYAGLAKDYDERLWAMTLITNSVLPGRFECTRVPPTRAEIESTSILKVRIVSGSGKIREGVPGEKKEDLNRPEVVDRVWTGVVPIWELFGGPIPGKNNAVNEIPEYIESCCKRVTQENEDYAQYAARS